MKHELTARRLQQAMNDMNISAQELSNKSGVAKASISQYVNGSHKPSNISSGKLANILKVNPLWLMGFEVSKIEEPATPTYTLSPKEERLVSDFRILNEDGQDYILQTMDMVKDKYKKPEGISNLEDIG